MDCSSNAKSCHKISRGMALEQKRPVMSNGMPIFEWTPGVPIDNEIEPDIEEAEIV